MTCTIQSIIGAPAGSTINFVTMIVHFIFLLIMHGVYLHIAGACLQEQTHEGPFIKGTYNAEQIPLHDKLSLYRNAWALKYASMHICCSYGHAVVSMCCISASLFGSEPIKLSILLDCPELSREGYKSVLAQKGGIRHLELDHD
jgi:hypothetical protein